MCLLQSSNEIVEVLRLVPSHEKHIVERICELILQSARLCDVASASDFEKVEKVVCLRMGTHFLERFVNRSCKSPLSTSRRAVCHMFWLCASDSEFERVVEVFGSRWELSSERICAQIVQVPVHESPSIVALCCCGSAPKLDRHR